MKYLQISITLLTIFIIAFLFLVPVDSSNPPPEPDLAHVISVRDWMNQWEKDNMDPAERDVRNAYNTFSGLVGDYASAIRSVGNVGFSAVSSSVQDKWVTLITSVWGVGKDLATGIAKTQTLQTAVETAASHHSTYLYNYNELYDKHGTVTRNTVAVQVQQEIAQYGGILISASTMMEAYYKYTFVVDDYNAKVEAWNAWAPSQQRDKVFTTVPSKTDFSKFECFGGCGYEHDTLDYARDTHKIDCGTAENIEAVARRAGLQASHGSNRVIATAIETAVRNEFQRRDLDDGCGRPYWACNSDDRESHEKQTCSTSGCSVKYRNCFPHTKDHSNHGSQASLSPSNGSYYASAGDIHQASLNLISGYTSLYWYVKSPSESGYGTSISSVTGSGSATTASFSYTFPSNAFGDYVITAYVYLSDGTIVEPSYTVLVSSGSTDTTSPSAPTPDTEDRQLCYWCELYGIEDGCGGLCIN